MNSGTAITGCVSLSWKITRSGSSVRSKPSESMLSRKSWIDAATKKYCCCSRSSLPCAWNPPGTAPWRCSPRRSARARPPRSRPELKMRRSNAFVAFALHSRSVFTRPFWKPGDHVVVRHGLDVPGGDPAGARHAVVVVRLGGAAEGDRLGGLRVRELPGRAEREPGVGLLDLLAVHERLPEHAVLVADPVADARHAQGGERVDETRGQAPEAAVAEARLDLLLRGARRG